MEKKVGKIIKEYRNSHGLTQQEFADKSGLSKSYISMLESGKHPRNGRAIIPTLDTFNKVATAMGIPLDALMRMMGNQLVKLSDGEPAKDSTAVTIPVLGKVVAGMPISAYEDVLGTEEITQEMADIGEHYALRVKGNSMYPQICEGDTVIVRVQSDVESEDVAVVFINGDEATLKKVKKDSRGITLYAFNSAVYEPHFYTNKEIKELPVTIGGKVVELRRSF